MSARRRCSVHGRDSAAGSRVLAGLVALACAALVAPVIADDSVDDTVANGTANGDALLLDADEAYARSRGALGNRIGAHRFQRANDAPIRLDAFRGRPVVMSLVFTSCYGTCGIISRRLAGAVDVAREALGEDSFDVVTVGFDARNDTPTRMAAYGRQQRIGDERWLLLSGDRATITALTGDVGFSFVPSPRGFDHVAQTTILDADGKVYRQIYGDAFSTPTLVEPLKALILGEAARAPGVGGWVAGVKLLCTIYDPASGRYRFDYSILVAAFAGALSLGAVAIFVLRSWNAGRHSHVD